VAVAFQQPLTKYRVYVGKRTDLFEKHSKGVVE